MTNPESPQGRNRYDYWAKHDPRSFADLCRVYDLDSRLKQGFLTAERISVTAEYITDRTYAILHDTLLFQHNSQDPRVAGGDLEEGIIYPKFFEQALALHARCAGFSEYIQVDTALFDTNSLGLKFKPSTFKFNQLVAGRLLFDYAFAQPGTNQPHGTHGHAFSLAAIAPVLNRVLGGPVAPEIMRELALSPFTWDYTFESGQGLFDVGLMFAVLILTILQTNIMRHNACITSELRKI